MSEILTVLLVILATHRITTFIVSDKLIEGPREAIQMWAERRWLEKHPGVEESDTWQSKLAYLLSCPWCVSPWVGGAVTLGTMWTVGLPSPILVWLAASSVTGLLSHKR